MGGELGEKGEREIALRTQRWKSNPMRAVAKPDGYAQQGAFELSRQRG